MTDTSNKEIQSHYDFIVVGAGAAGSVLAAELSASGAQILVVESGGPDDAPTIANPSVWFYNVGGPLYCHLPVNPQPQLNNRTFNMALGHVLGGGSSINAMVWTRGMQRDYDGWAKNGAEGWAFADGPIHIRRPKNPHPTAPAFIDAAREMGMPILDDVNGPMVPGAGYINMNIAADGTRVSAARAFLRPALAKPNLTLLLNTAVVKLNFKGIRCAGVRINTGAEVRDIAAGNEVILTAGSINSPKRRPRFQGYAARSLPRCLRASEAVEAEAYLSSGPPGDPESDIDINLVFEQLPVVTPEAAARFDAPPEDVFTIAPAFVQLTSRGTVRLASNNFQDAAVIDGNYLRTDRDFAAIVREIEIMPGPKATAGEIRELARLGSASFGHAVGTCKMGVDKLAVVDPQLRVHGLTGLRVADASIMPRIITGPTNAPTHMIAGRAARLILGENTHYAERRVSV